MQRFWETLGQALLDTNFRRYRILRTGRRERCLPDNFSMTTLHDYVNKIPGRYPMSRFEVGELMRLFSQQAAVDIAMQISRYWADFCRNRPQLMYPDLSTGFKTALGLAATDEAWIGKIMGEGEEEATEHVYMDMGFEEKNCFLEFLNYAPDGQPDPGCKKSVDTKSTRCLLKEFESLGWSIACFTSVTLARDYIHPRQDDFRGRTKPRTIAKDLREPNIARRKKAAKKKAPK